MLVRKILEGNPERRGVRSPPNRDRSDRMSLEYDFREDTSFGGQVAKPPFVHIIK